MFHSVDLSNSVTLIYLYFDIRQFVVTLSASCCDKEILLW